MRGLIIQTFVKIGCHQLPENLNSVNLVISGVDKTHKCTKNYCSEVCNISKSNISANRQHDSTYLPGRNEVGDVLIVWNFWKHPRGIFTNQPEYLRKLEIQEIPEFKWLGFGSSNLFSQIVEIRGVCWTHDWTIRYQNTCHGSRTKGVFKWNFLSSHEETSMGISTVHFA